MKIQQGQEQHAPRTSHEVRTGRSMMMHDGRQAGTSTTKIVNRHAAIIPSWTLMLFCLLLIPLATM